MRKWSFRNAFSWVGFFFLFCWWVLSMYRYNLICFCHRHLYFFDDFFCFSRGHNGFDISMLLRWTGTCFMHSFKIRHWLTWEFAFLNNHCQGLNWEASYPTTFLRFESDWVCELKSTLLLFFNSSIVLFCCSIVEWVRFLKFWNTSSHGLGWE